MMIRSIVSNWATLLITAATSVLLTPMLVHGLGHLYFGLWVLAGSLVDYFGLLDVGIRTTLQRFVARLSASGDRRALSETFATGMALTLGVAAVILVATALLMLLPTRLLGIDDAIRPLFRPLVVLLGMSVSTTVLARFLGAYICGLQRFDLYNVAAVVCVLLRAAIIIVAIKLGEGVLWVGIATLASSLLMLGLHWYFVRRLEPDLRFSLAYVKVERARELISFSIYIFLITASEYVRTYSPSVIIARVLGVAMITPFNIASRLMDYIMSIILGLIGPLMPKMSALFGQERYADLRELTLQAVRLTALLASLAAWTLFLNGDELIRVWLGPGFEISVKLMLIMLVGVILAQVQSPGGPALIACGKHRVYAWWALGEAVATVLLAVLLVTKYGLPGVAFAMTIPRVLVKTTIQPWYVLRVLGLSSGEYLRRALLRPVLVNALFLVICLATNAFASTTGLRMFLWNVAWESAAFLVLTYAVGLTPTSRHLVRQCLRSLGVKVLGPPDIPQVPDNPRALLTTAPSTLSEPRAPQAFCEEETTASRPHTTTRQGAEAELLRTSVDSDRSRPDLS